MAKVSHFSFSTFVIGHEFPARGAERPVDQLTGHRPLSARQGVVAITTNTQPALYVVRCDHWSTICRPIIGKVQSKISNVSPQIIKHILCMFWGLNR